MNYKKRHTFEKRYVLGTGLPWLNGHGLAGVLTLDGREKRLVRPPAIDRHSFWDRPKYRLVLEKI